MSQPEPRRLDRVPEGDPEPEGSARRGPPFAIITGLSGAGRSEAARCLEDLGYFVVDNLPPELLATMAELAARPGGPARVGIVVDARGGVFFGELAAALGDLKRLHIAYRILYLEASDEDLVNRYEATRHRHPLAPADRVVEGIRKERLMMESLRGDADLIIDTSNLTPHDLREKIRDAFADAPPEESLQVSLISFGYKYGIPYDADLVLDAAGCGPRPRRAVPDESVLGSRAAPPDRGGRVRPLLRLRAGALSGVHHAARGAPRPRGPRVRRRGEVLPDDRGGMHGRTPSVGRRRVRARSLLSRARPPGIDRPSRRRPRLTDSAPAAPGPGARRTG